jgi:hypothetical protein
MFSIPRIYVFLICVLISQGYSYSQTSAIDIDVSVNRGKDTLYAKYDNEFRIYFKYSLQHLSFDSIVYIYEQCEKDLVVTCSQGDLIRRLRNTQYFIKNLNRGKATINVSRNTDTGLQLLLVKTLVVSKRPEITIVKAFLSGYHEGRIPVSVITKARRIKLNKPKKFTCEFTSAVIYITGPSYSKAPYIKVIKEFTNGKFDKEVRQEFKQLKPGNTIVIDEIKVIVDGNTRQLPSMAFNVVADEKMK